VKSREGEFLPEEAEFTITRKEGWIQFVQRQARERPPIHSTEQLAAMSGLERRRYEESRKVWHANLGPIKTPQMDGVQGALEEILDAARQDGDKVKGAAVIDALPGLGKTTTALRFAKGFHREQVELYGESTPEGHQRVPAVFLTLSGSVTVKGLNGALCRFYGLPSQRGTAEVLADRARDAVLSCRTRLIVVDDIHFLNLNRQDDRAVVNHLKYLSSSLPVTFLFVGVGIEARGLLSEGLGLTSEESARAQLARRWTVLSLARFEIDTNGGRMTWRRLLLGAEQLLLLNGKYPGMLADDLSAYLFARSSGHFASLMTILQRGCRRAILSGDERLTRELLDQVRNDAAAEETRLELQSAFDQRLRTTRVISRHRSA